MLRKSIRLAHDFDDQVYRAQLTKRELARLSGIAYQTIHALQNPTQHPNRKGGMNPATAWKLANAFAAHCGISPQDAYMRLIIEEILQEQ